jgi:transposase
MERSGSGSQRAAERINCLGQQLAALQQLETQMRALDQQYASEPGRAHAEKSTLYLRNMPRGCN